MRRPGRRTAAIVTMLAVAVATGAFTAAAGGDRGDASPPAKTPTATAKVTRGDMVASETVSGTLGYGPAGAVTNRLTGTITWIAQEGSTVKRGGRLYEVDGQPVVLLYGTTPAYRSLSVGVAGEDVRQLERNLDALGYGDGLKVDDEFTSATARAVRQWQEDLGVAETGAVELGRAVFAGGTLRVSEHRAEVGTAAAPGAQVFTATSTRRVVSVDLPVADQTLARRGGTVTVELPDGRTTKGKVSRVGTVARSGSEDGQGGSDDATIEVEVTLDDPKAAGRLDQAPVDVRFESERRKGVLSVPVNALLALREGGYGVAVVDGNGSRIVAVRTGMFANGRVEVSGAGLREGMSVEVPAS